MFKLTIEDDEGKTTVVPLARDEITIGRLEGNTIRLTELGGVSQTGLLGLEVIWTPADANDSMTETDVMTTYPELRSL